MNITIVGAGNIGTQFAVLCSEKGHRVILYGSKPEKIHQRLSIVNENGAITHTATIQQATNDAEIAFADAHLVFVTMPANFMRQTANTIVPYANPNMRICLVPGTGGGECAFRTCIAKGATVFGLQRVPSISRLVEYGRTVKAVGYRKELFAAAIPHVETKKCCEIIEGLFDIPCRILPNYLNITLTPSNPVLHTTRLRQIFANYHVGMVYEKLPLFYEDWDNETSELLLACDGEVQEICAALRPFDLSYVKSLKIHYESLDAESLTKKLSTIESLKGLTSPAIPVEGGYVPDFSSRYFTADFSYGLSILLSIAAFVGVNVPNMKSTLDWYHGLVPCDDEFSFANYGIHTDEEFAKFYML